VKRTTSSIAVAALILAGGMAASAQDTAQGQPVPAAAPTSQPEEIIVTGSRIKRTDLVAESPTAFVDAEDIAQLSAVNVEDVLRTMPQALPGISKGVNNGNPGVATVNLRALDDERTLVLVNGKRFVGYDSEGIVDLNNIPTTLIDRVDVVTGGASAVYGSDAIAGVVNFILKDDFEGVQFDYNYANALRGGENTNAFSATLGVNTDDERGNVTLFAGWTNRSAVTQGDRWFSERSISTATGGFGGSSTDTNGNIICGGCSYSGPDGPNFGAQTFVGFESANGNLIPRGSRRFNFNPYNLLQVPQERYQATALAHYELAEWADPYLEFTFAQTQVDTVIAPSGTFFLDFDIPFDSIYLTQQSRDVLFGRPTGAGAYPLSFDSNGDGVVGVGPGGVDSATYALGRRTIEVGPRITRNRTQAWHLVGGVRGIIPFAEGWSYDLSVQRGHTELSRLFENDLKASRVQDILDASSPTINPGAVDGGPCHVGGGCVVGSLFGDGSLNSGAASYIALSLNEDVYVDQDIVHFDVSGDFGETVKIPGASPIGASFGAEWRRVQSESFPDDCYATPDCSIGFGSTSSVIGEFDVKEFFGELRVPILEEKPFAYALTLSGAYRWADYSHTGTADAWKVGGEYMPIADFLFRVNYQRAVRAPNIFEFAQPFTPTLDNSNGDPCAAYNEASGLTSVDQFTRDLCVATGVNPALFTPVGPNEYTTGVPDVIAGQINVFSGGNTQLKEEEARTLTVGGVYGPSWLEGLNISIDWYRVEIDDPISSIDADVILRGCYDPAQNPTGDANTLLCSLVSRNPLSGGLIGSSQYGLDQTERNIGFLKSEGIDFQVDYLLDAGSFGVVEIGFFANKVLKINDKPTPISPTNVCKGKYGAICDSPNPSVSFSQRTTWTYGDVSLGYRWRYLRGTDFEQPVLSIESGGQSVDIETCLKAYCSISDTHYVDLLVYWEPSNIDMLQGFTFQMGLENVFDEDPPIVGSEAGTTTQNSGNTFPGTFDTIGRTLTIRMSKKF
jgi:outer membrane receptor protein involved in Fe transport